MKTSLFIITCTLALTQAYGEDVSDILSQISAEKESKKQTAVNSIAIQPAKPPQKAEKRKELNKETPKSKTKTSVNQRKEPTPPQTPRIIVYRPKDKLPKNVVGSGVAGDFLVTGEDPFGGASLIAAEDAMNPFARSFIIKNMSSGYSPGTVLPLDNRKLIRIAAAKPLIFIGRGMLPGSYEVRAQ